MQYTGKSPNMKFDGFIAGVELTPVPSPLLAQLLAGMDDLVELKLALRIIWLLNHKPANQRFLTANELATDDIVSKIVGLTADDLVNGVKELAKGLCHRNILVLAFARGENYFFLNTEPARQMIRSGRFKPAIVESDAEAIPADEFEHGSAKVVKAYEENIGMLSPFVAERLNDLLHTYSEADIMDAIEVAALNNARHINYIGKVLMRKERRFGKDQERAIGEIPELTAEEYFTRRR